MSGFVEGFVHGISSWQLMGDGIRSWHPQLVDELSQNLDPAELASNFHGGYLAMPYKISDINGR